MEAGEHPQFGLWTVLPTKVGVGSDNLLLILHNRARRGRRRMTGMGSAEGKSKANCLGQLR